MLIVSFHYQRLWRGRHIVLEIWVDLALVVVSFSIEIACVLWLKNITNVINMSSSNNIYNKFVSIGIVKFLVATAN